MESIFETRAQNLWDGETPIKFKHNGISCEVSTLDNKYLATAYNGLKGFKGTLENPKDVKQIIIWLEGFVGNL